MLRNFARFAMRLTLLARMALLVTQLVGTAHTRRRNGRVECAHVVWQHLRCVEHERVAPVARAIP